MMESSRTKVTYYKISIIIKIQNQGLENVTPRDLFESDLCWQLQVWRALGDRIILMMDANCNVLTGRLGRMLTQESIG